MEIRCLLQQNKKKHIKISVLDVECRKHFQMRDLHSFWYMEDEFVMIAFLRWKLRKRIFWKGKSHNMWKEKKKSPLDYSKMDFKWKNETWRNDETKRNEMFE